MVRNQVGLPGDFGRRQQKLRGEKLRSVEGKSWRGGNGKIDWFDKWTDKVELTDDRAMDFGWAREAVDGRRWGNLDVKMEAICLK